jgi:hypothetical protein
MFACMYSKDAFAHHDIYFPARTHMLLYVRPMDWTHAPAHTLTHALIHSCACLDMCKCGFPTHADINTQIFASLHKMTRLRLRRFYSTAKARYMMQSRVITTSIIVPTHTCGVYACGCVDKYTLKSQNSTDLLSALCMHRIHGNTHKNFKSTHADTCTDCCSCLTSCTHRKASGSTCVYDHIDEITRVRKSQNIYIRIARQHAHVLVWRVYKHIAACFEACRACHTKWKHMFRIFRDLHHSTQVVCRCICILAYVHNAGPGCTPDKGVLPVCTHIHLNNNALASRMLCM